MKQGWGIDTVLYPFFVGRLRPLPRGETILSYQNSEYLWMEWHVKKWLLFHLSHPAFADLGGDFVVGEFGSG